MKANDGNMLNKNLWKIANVVHKRKFIALNKHVRKEERLKIQWSKQIYREIIKEQQIKPREIRK